MQGSTIGTPAIRVYRSGRSLLGVTQNPEATSSSTASPMNLPLGGTVNT
jgi:hypothetical protein